MAVQLGKIEETSVHTEVSHGNLSVRTSFALPGWMLPPTYVNENYVIRCRVMDDLSVEVCFKGGSTFWQTVRNNDYSVRFVASKWYWNWSYSGDRYAIFPSDAVSIADAVIRVGNADGIHESEFRWNPTPDRWVRVCSLGDLGYDPSSPNNAYLWVGGTGTYQVTGPIYPSPIRITIPNIRQYMNYYPFAVRQGLFLSCNRAGGYVKRLTDVNSRTWSDVKNANNHDPNNSKAFERNAGNNGWDVSPKTGAQAL